MKCSKCQQEKSESEFPKRGKWCKVCANEYFRSWRENKKNDDDFIKKEQARQKEWWEKNRERGNERQREYRKNSTHFQLSNALRARVKYALIGCVRQDKTFDLLGCSPIEWKEHLEKMFLDGMTWENYGLEWEVDHIIPVSHFDLQCQEQQKKAFHYSNTQPMWKHDNRRKGNRWVG
jgi:hypothetical protein